MGENGSEKRGGGSLRSELGILTAYSFFGVCGMLVFVTPSVSLAVQGGRFIVYAWAGFCLLGAVMGCLGIVRRSIFTELWGASLTASASLTWAVSLVLQAIDTENAATLTAAGMASALTVLLLQRWLDANRSPRE